MVIKGSARGATNACIRRLAAHLLDDENEQVEVIEITGSTANDLASALGEMRALSLGTRTRRAVYHASINAARDEARKMTRALWLESVAELEQRLGFVGHPRAVVLHSKRGREHVHVVWSRVHPLTLRTSSDANSYRRHEECSRALEERFGLRPVIGAHTRTPGTPRPRAKATHGDWQASERTGIAVEDVAARIRGAWHESGTGAAFAVALTARGLSLATGRRGLLVVDEMGTPHSISRRLGIKAAEVTAKLSDLNPARVPVIGETRKRQRRKGKTMEEKFVCCLAPKTPATEADLEALESYWRGLGFDPVRRWECLYIDAYGGTIRDYGSRLEIVTDEEPTDEQIAALVRAGRERGWQSIRFYGGSPEWQQRARLEALRQGFPADAISLECEDNQHPKEIAIAAMPEHLRKRLGLPDTRDAPTPAPEQPEAPAPRLGR